MSSKKDKIVQAAVQLFVERGFDGTSTAAITRKAGVAAGTLFHHFETKEKLIEAIYIQVKTEITNALNGAGDGEGNARDLFRGGWTNFLRYCVENPGHFRFSMTFANSPLISERITEKIKKEFLDVLYLPIEAGRREGCLRDLPDELIYSVMTNLTLATAQYLIDHPGKLDDEQFMDTAFASYWRAISNE